MTAALPLSPEELDELRAALQTERVQLLLVGAPPQTTAVLEALVARLEPEMPVARTLGECTALARAREWLCSIDLAAGTEKGWCIADPRQGDLSAVVTVSWPDPLWQIEQARAALGEDTRFILFMEEAQAAEIRESLLRRFKHRVLEVQLTSGRPQRSRSHALARAEAALVVLILTLVGLSTLWFTDQAISEPFLNRVAPALWSIRP